MAELSAQTDARRRVAELLFRAYTDQSFLLELIKKPILVINSFDIKLPISVEITVVTPSFDQMIYILPHDFKSAEHLIWFSGLPKAFPEAPRYFTPIRLPVGEVKAILDRDASSTSAVTLLKNTQHMRNIVIHYLPSEWKNADRLASLLNSDWLLHFTGISHCVVSSKG